VILNGPDCSLSSGQTSQDASDIPSGRNKYNRHHPICVPFQRVICAGIPDPQPMLIIISGEISPIWAEHNRIEVAAQ
jgi:hypothetical protein